MIRFFYVIFVNLYRIPYMVSKMRHQANHPEKYSEVKRYNLARRAFTMVRRSGHVRTKAYGEENLPKEGGYVMFSNHQGKYDVLGIMLSHKEPCSFVMDKNKSNTIIVSEIVDLVQGKRLDKNDVRQALTIINEVAQEVREERKYIFFPEGGYEFNNKNVMGIFRPGSFKCAVKAKAPIVPVAIIDSYKVFNSFTIGRVTTQVHFLKPFFYEDYKGLKTTEIAELVKERIGEVLAQYSLAK